MSLNNLIMTFSIVLFLVFIILTILFYRVIYSRIQVPSLIVKNIVSRTVSRLLIIIVVLNMNQRMPMSFLHKIIPQITPFLNEKSRRREIPAASKLPAALRAWFLAKQRVISNSCTACVTISL